MSDYKKADAAWIGKEVTPAQKDTVEKIVKKQPDLKSKSMRIEDKYDAWKFIDKYIHVLKNQDKPVSKGQRDEIAYIEKWLFVKFDGTTHKEADEFIKLHFSTANEADRRQRKALDTVPKSDERPKCKRCKTQNATFYDEENGGGPPIHCFTCYSIVSKERREKFDKSEEYKDLPFEPEPVEDIKPGCHECGGSLEGGNYLDFRTIPTKDVCHPCYRKIRETPEYKKSVGIPSHLTYDEHQAIIKQKDTAKYKKAVGLTSTKSNKQPKEENKMMKNLKGLLGEFGKDTSGRFCLSFQGLAVKIGDSFVVFDGSDVTDVMDFVIPKSDGMIFKMPATVEQLAKGDVILAKDRVLFVKKVTGKSIIAIDPQTNDEIKHIPVKNMFGFQFYTKVVSLLNFGQPTGDGQPAFNPMMLMLMGGDDESGEESKLEDLLPLMMMSGQFGGAQGTVNPMQQMLPMLLMSGKGGNSDMMSMMMMSQAFGGQQGNANPFGALFGQPAAPVAETKEEEA